MNYENNEEIGGGSPWQIDTYSHLKASPKETRKWC